MNQGIKTVIYPVKDIAQAKTLYSELLGEEPYGNEAYYIGFGGGKLIASVKDAGGNIIGLMHQP